MAKTPFLERNDTFIEVLIITTVKLIGDLKPRFPTNSLPTNDLNTSLPRNELAKRVLRKLSLIKQDPEAV